MTRSLFLLVPIWMAAGSVVLAQDTTRVEEGVRVGVDYSPGTRPGLVVLPGSGIDSARAMIRRDLDYSDRFEMITVGDQVSSTGTGTGPQAGPVNYELYKGMGAEFAVELSQATGGVTVRLHDLNAARLRNQQTVSLSTGPDSRLEVHRLADEITRWASGTPGAAASRMLFVSGGRVYRADSDGHDITPLTPAGQTALSPAWSPDAQRIAFTQLGEGRGGIVVQALSNCCQLRSSGFTDGAQHHTGLLPRRADARVCALRRARHRHLYRQCDGTLLRATLDRRTLRGQLIPNVFARWAAHRVHFHACRTASVVRDGCGRNRSGAAGAIRFRRHRKFECSRVVSGRSQCRISSGSFREPANFPGGCIRPASAPTHVVRPKRRSHLGSGRPARSVYL